MRARQMFGPVGIAGEVFEAHCAAVGFVPRVDPLVLVQLVWATKAFGAVCALVFLCFGVCFNVIDETVPCVVRSTADLQRV